MHQSGVSAVFANRLNCEVIPTSRKTRIERDRRRRPCNAHTGSPITALCTVRDTSSSGWCDARLTDGTLNAVLRHFEDAQAQTGRHLRHGEITRRVVNKSACPRVHRTAVPFVESRVSLRKPTCTKLYVPLLNGCF